MVLGLRKKIFLLVLVANLIMAGLFASLMANRFKGQLLTYVNDIDNRRTSQLVDKLAEGYLVNNSWSFVNNDQRWMAFLRQHQEVLMRGRTKNDGMTANNPGAARSILLANENKRIMVGNPRPPMNTLWIDIEANSRIVGYLGVIQNLDITQEADQLFFSRVKKEMLWIVVAALLVSTLLALPFAYGLVRPIRRLREATRFMAQGQYDRRVSISGADELTQLSADFNWLAQSLESNQQARQQWVADISHELRTPLAVLRAELDAILDGVRQPSADNMQSLSEEVHRLMALVNDLHQLSLSDAGALTYQCKPLDLNLWLDSFVKAVAQQRQDLTLHFHPASQPIWVSADPQRLDQLFGNLLQNTEKYSLKPADLWVSIAPGAYVVWEDSGPGVPDDALPYLFDRLYRVDNSRNRDTGGSGLGLAICANIVKAHQGDIVASQSKKGGLKLRVHLPATPPPMTDTEATE
jgi:two-component system sensor histidine kinase BaeS